jgi:alpha-amylase/alpha-mannosidase (GH57 family)
MTGGQTGLRLSAQEVFAFLIVMDYKQFGLKIWKGYIQ